MNQHSHKQFLFIPPAATATSQHKIEKVSQAGE
jgi:hypothetical protein